MISIPLELPFPPSVNHYWKSIGKGRHVLSSEAVNFHATARALIYAQLSRMRPKPRMIEHAVAVKIIFHQPDRYKRDIDNLSKAVLDTLTRANIWKDDSLVHCLHMEWGKNIKGGKAVVTIRDINEE